LSVVISEQARDRRHSVRHSDVAFKDDYSRDGLPYAVKRRATP
jgi:hypothetical protein